MSATTRDADWVVKLIDVRPDGFAHNLVVGIQRGTFRESEMEPTPLVPGRRYRIDVDLGNAAARISVGHRLRVEITGSYFPLFERNTNTAKGPFSGQTLIAEQTVEHATGVTSRVLLPVLEERSESTAF